MSVVLSGPDGTSKVSCTNEETLIERIRGEFLEMPGLCLTWAQAARLLALERDTSRELPRKLWEAGFLRLTVNGAYVRNSST